VNEASIQDFGRGWLHTQSGEFINQEYWSHIVDNR
jgi:hypothetical protein